MPLLTCHKDLLKMLASTVQFSRYGRAHNLPAPTPRGAVHPVIVVRHAEATRRSRTGPRSGFRPFPQDPTACLARRRPVRFRSTREVLGRPLRRATGRCSTHELPPRSVRPRSGALDAAMGAKMLLRKEVIQPHLPVRLPCYDFVPIAGPTFDGSLHKG